MLSFVVFGLRVIDHRHRSHATLGFRAARSLLRHADMIDACIRAGLSPRVALPLPRLGRTEGFFRSQALRQLFAGIFGDTSHRRFRNVNSRQLDERGLRRLAEASEQPSERDGFLHARRHAPLAQPQRFVPGHLTRAATRTVVIRMRQPNVAEQTLHHLRSPVHELRARAASASTATTAVPLF